MKLSDFGLKNVTNNLIVGPGICYYPIKSYFSNMADSWFVRLICVIGHKKRLLLQTVALNFVHSRLTIDYLLYHLVRCHHIK